MAIKNEDEIFCDLACQIAEQILDTDDWNDIVVNDNSGKELIRLKQSYYPFFYKNEIHTYLKNIKYLSGYEGIDWLVFRLPKHPLGFYGLKEVSTAKEKQAIYEFNRSKKAGDKGDTPARLAEAQFNLGSFFEANGNLQEAKRWYNKSAKNGNDYSKQALLRLMAASTHRNIQPKQTTSPPTQNRESFRAVSPKKEGFFSILWNFGKNVVNTAFEGDSCRAAYDGAKGGKNCDIQLENGVGLYAQQGTNYFYDKDGNKWYYDRSKDKFWKE